MLCTCTPPYPTPGKLLLLRGEATAQFSSTGVLRTDSIASEVVKDRISLVGPKVPTENLHTANQRGKTSERPQESHGSRTKL